MTSGNGIIQDVFTGEISDTGAVVGGSRNRIDSRGRAIAPSAQNAKVGVAGITGRARNAHE